jgi:hypothetical protein
MLNIHALAIATAIGTILQLAMVVSGHTNKTIAGLFAVGGMGISLVAGLIYGANVSTGLSGRGIGGMLAGGICAFIGIAVSYRYGDVPASLLILGTVSSMVTGALGGWLGRFLASSGGAAIAVGVGTLLCADQAQAQSIPHSSILRGPVVADASATTTDFAWLVGSWQGTLDSGAGTPYVTYSEPHAGFMTGVMHLVSPEKKILVVELITLIDTPRGVEMRFRHFSSDLQAYESDFQQAMLLTSHDASRDVFQNQVAYSKALMSTQPRTTTITRQPDGSFVARSDIIGEDGKPSVISGTYRRPAKRD